MTIKLVEDGDVLQTVCTGAVTAGWLVIRGAIRGVAMETTAVAGDALRLDVGGHVFSLDKIAAASTALTVGAKVYARATGSAGRLKVLGLATGVVIGTAWEAAATGATKAVVKLHGFAI